MGKDQTYPASKRGSQLITHALNDDRFADMLDGNSMSLDDGSMLSSQKTLREGMKVFFDDGMRNKKAEAGADVLIVDNNVYFALALINQLKRLGLSYDHVQEADKAEKKIERRFTKY